MCSYLARATHRKLESERERRREREGKQIVSASVTESDRFKGHGDGGSRAHLKLCFHNKNSVRLNFPLWSHLTGECFEVVQKAATKRDPGSINHIFKHVGTLSFWHKSRPVPERPGHVQTMFALTTLCAALYGFSLESTKRLWSHCFVVRGEAL